MATHFATWASPTYVLYTFDWPWLADIIVLFIVLCTMLLLIGLALNPSL